MDVQTVLNIIFGCVGGLAGWILNSLSRSIIRMEDRISELPILYVTKDDYRRDIDDIKIMLNDIYKELRSKVDK